MRINGKRFDDLTKTLGAASSRRSTFKVLAGATMGALVARATGRTASAQAPTATAPPVTHLIVSNETAAPVQVWLTLGRVPGCVGLDNIPFITNRVNPDQGWFTLAPHDSQDYSVPPGQCISGNYTFGTPPQNCPDRTQWPNGINLAEFTINNSNQGPSAQETIDNSAVYGANARIRFNLSGGGPWNAGGSRPNITSFENRGLMENVNVIGVFPYGCDDCTNRMPPTVMCPGPNVPPFPGVCSAEHLCNVQRDAASGGGSVQIIFNGFIR
jgi:hypothetical protein